MKRYLGNTNHMEVHDTLAQRPACQIAEIRPEHKRWFDTLQQAKAAGFDPCDHCLPGSTR